MNIQALIVHCLSLIALCLFSLVITCLAIPQWGTNTETNFSTGLNYYCNGSNCYPYLKGEKVGYLFATGFFIWVSVFVSFLASVVSVSSSFYAIKDGEYNGMKILSVILAVLFGVLGICMLIAVLCFSTGFKGFQFEFSYFLSWAVFSTSFFISLVLATSRLSIYYCRKFDCLEKYSFIGKKPRADAFQINS